MRLPARPRGATSDVILMLIDLGLRPLVIGTIMSMSTQYVYTVLRNNGRIKGDGRSGDIIRFDPNLHRDYSRVRPYLERLFFDCEPMFHQLHNMASVLAKNDNLPVRPGRKPISHVSGRKAA
jgi:hypothetical protein